MIQSVQFGPYTVGSQPSKVGGQAFVYFTVDPDTGDRVAVKVARPSKWSERRMKEEIKAQQRLDHPNVLRILAHGENFRWYTTYRAEASLEERGPFPREQWTSLRVGLIAAASALAHAHSKNFIHRDLSPGNILVFRHGWAVSDWGFVHAPQPDGARITQPLEHFGTPDFSAPEVLSDPMNVTTAADIFSIGRLAAWGTGLRHAAERKDDDSVIGWWRFLIDNTTDYDARRRWTIRDVQTYLSARPAAVAKPAPRDASPPPQQRRPGVVVLSDYRRDADECPVCGQTVGRDATEHCLGCHAHLAY